MGKGDGVAPVLRPVPPNIRHREPLQLFSKQFLEGGFSEVRIAPVRSRGYWTGAERLRTLREYAPRRSSDPMALQEVLFPYLDAL